MSSIHYKFGATLDYKTLQFDGLHITGADLKKELCAKEGIRAEGIRSLIAECLHETQLHSRGTYPSRFIHHSTTSTQGRCRRIVQSMDRRPRSPPHRINDNRSPVRRKPATPPPAPAPQPKPPKHPKHVERELSYGEINPLIR